MTSQNEEGVDEEKCQLCLDSEADKYVELGDRKIPLCSTCRIRYERSSSEFKEFMEKLKKLRKWEREVWGR